MQKAIIWNIRYSSIDTRWGERIKRVFQLKAHLLKIGIYFVKSIVISSVKRIFLFSENQIRATGNHSTRRTQNTNSAICYYHWWENHGNFMQKIEKHHSKMSHRKWIKIKCFNLGDRTVFKSINWNYFPINLMNIQQMKCKYHKCIDGENQRNV